MSRQTSRQLKRMKQKSLSQKPAHESVSKGTRFFITVFSSAFILLFLYEATRDNAIANEELSTVSVTLKDTPQYDEYTIKSSTYRDIILTTEEYHKVFKIVEMTYAATDHNALKSGLFPGDQVVLKVRKSELDNLQESTFWDRYTEVYGLTKNGYDYIDLDKRTALKDEDSKWSYFFVLLGLVMLPYGFIKGKPMISIKTTVIGFAVLLILVLLLMGEL
jgi:hypothetical protein